MPAPKLQRQVPSLALAGLGLILSGAAIWALLTDAGTGYAAWQTDSTAVPATVDFEAPRLKLSGLDGLERSLAEYLGQVVLVNLWATWCPPCIAEMPTLQRFYERHRAEGFTVIAINDGERSSRVKAFVDAHELTFAVWLDPTFEATDRAFKTRGLPSSYVINRGGVVKLMWVGEISESNLEKFMVPLLKE